MNRPSNADRTRAIACLVEGSSQRAMPGLTGMTKRQMVKMLQSVWTLCDEEMVPTHNTSQGLEWHPKKAGGLSLYGRVYCALVRRQDWLPVTNVLP